MLKNKNKLLTSLLIFAIYSTHNWINFFYNSTRNVDFSKYYDYLNYFLGNNVILDYGQGSLYYYLVSLFIARQIDLINIGNIDLIINVSIQELNLVLFLIGLWGLYKLLEINSYDKKNIILCLILLNFFPQSLYMRAVMKPEILAFSFFPWCLYFVELFIENKNVKYIYISLPAFVIIINTKASLAAMMLLYLLIFYSKVFKLLKFKQIFSIILVFLLLVSLIQIENFNITQLLPFERAYDEEYDFKADPKILFNVDFVEVLRNPFCEYTLNEASYCIHSKSLINLTILDTFGDHFDQLFNSTENNFSKNRKHLFINDLDSLMSTNREIKYNGPFSHILVDNLDYARKIVSSLIAILFYFLLILFSLLKKNKRKYFLAPFVGIFILYLNSLGIPSNNFNPFKGDTFKAFYYSFLLVTALSVLVCEVFKRYKYVTNFLITTIFCISILFISGHPKSNNQEISVDMIIANEYSIFCKVNNFIIFDNDYLKEIHPSGNIENYKSDCDDNSTANFLLNQNFDDYKNQKKEICFNNKNILIEIKSIEEECRIFWMIEAQNLDNDNKKPTVAYLYFLFMISILFFDTKFIKSYINKKVNNNVKKTKF